MALFRLSVCLLFFCVWACAAETFYSIPVGDLQIPPGTQWPQRNAASSLRGQDDRIVMDNGEAYVLDPNSLGRWNPQQQDALKLAVRADAAAPVAGTIYFAANQFVSFDDGAANKPIASLRFTATPQSTPEAKTDFYRAKAIHYRALQSRGGAGAAWFRHSASSAIAQLPAGDDTVPQPWGAVVRDDARYDLFTGGRAISENLQLDRDLRQRDVAGQPDVDVDSITGIEVAAMDFKALLGDTKPALDPLSTLVPQDQYALFFASPQAMFAVMDKADQSVLPAVDSFMPGGEDAGIAGRYERQLCLERSAAGRLLLNQSVKTVAITGSDPFFPLGTDVALIFQADNPAMLAGLVNAQVAMAASKQQVRPETMQIAGVNVTQYRSADRAVSSYVAVIRNAVIVANSPVQIRRIAETAEDKSLGTAPEYMYFRSEYQIGPDESLLLVIPDAAIRKWCSARWRIGSARRIGARAKMLEQIATSIDAQNPANAADPVYGSRDFATPVSELEFTKVTASEAEAYKQWRDGYQRNWRGAFDPIALRLQFEKQAIRADLMVMPLIASTDYRQFIEITRNGKLEATSGDPHDDLLHFVIALDRESKTLKGFSDMGDSISGMRIDLLGWLGRSAAIYVDDDPFWDEVLASDNTERHLEKNFDRLPVALRVDSTSPLKLAALLATIRSKIEQSAPGLTIWENLEYAGKTYVKVSSAEKHGEGAESRLAVYYAALPDSLTITLNEALLKRALDRAAGQAPAKPAGPWLGSNVAVRIKSDAANFMARTAGSREREVQRASWANIPILNEWKRLFPNEDPVAFHQRAWGTKLICPAGGEYVWNQELQTMQSTVAGSPEAPRELPHRDLVMNQFTAADFGLTFQNGGLHAAMLLDSDPAKARKPATMPTTRLAGNAAGNDASNQPSSDELAKRCMVNLRQVGQGVLIYANDNKGRLPDSLGQLTEVEMTPATFICPAHLDAPKPPHMSGTVNVKDWIQTNSDYVYLGKGKRFSSNYEQVLAYDNSPRHNGKVATLFFDGHSELLTPEQLKERLAK